MFSLLPPPLAQFDYVIVFPRFLLDETTAKLPATRATETHGVWFGFAYVSMAVEPRWGIV